MVEPERRDMEFAGTQSRALAIRRIADTSRKKSVDRLEQAKTEARGWKTGFWFTFTLLVGAVAALVYTALQPRFVPYTVAVDEHGIAVPIGPAQRTSASDPGVIRAELTRFIGYARSVSSDPHAQRAMVERAYAYAAPATANVLNAYFRDARNDARVVSGRAIRLVRVLRVTPLPAPADNTWNVLWEETEIEHGSEARRTASWEAYLTVSPSRPSGLEQRTEEQVALNPLGIYITDLSWSPIVNNESQAVRSR